MALHDTNDDLLQVELSRAAHACSKAGASFANFKCVAAHTYGGLPEPLATQAFAALWSSPSMWLLCSACLAAISVWNFSAPRLLRASGQSAARGNHWPARLTALPSKLYRV